LSWEDSSAVDVKGAGGAEESVCCCATEESYEDGGCGFHVGWLLDE